MSCTCARPSGAGRSTVLVRVVGLVAGEVAGPLQSGQRRRPAAVRVKVTVEEKRHLDLREGALKRAEQDGGIRPKFGPVVDAVTTLDVHASGRRGRGPRQVLEAGGLAGDIEATDKSPPHERPGADGAPDPTWMDMLTWVPICGSASKAARIPARSATAGPFTSVGPRLLPLHHGHRQDCLFLNRSLGVASPPQARGRTPTDDPSAGGPNVAPTHSPGPELAIILIAAAWLETPNLV